MSDSHPTPEPPPSDLVEKLAAYAHSAWSGWMKYLFSKGTIHADGSWVMPPWAVRRWQRQMATPYEALSEPEKESDRKEAFEIIRVAAELDPDGPTAVDCPTCGTFLGYRCIGKDGLVYIATGNVLWDLQLNPGTCIRCRRHFYWSPSRKDLVADPLESIIERYRARGPN